MTYQEWKTVQNQGIGMEKLQEEEYWREDKQKGEQSDYSAYFFFKSPQEFNVNNSIPFLHKPT